MKAEYLLSISDILSKLGLMATGETERDLGGKGDLDKLCGPSSFFSGSFGKSNGLFGINNPFGKPGIPEKFGGRPAAAKLDDKEDKLDGNPPAKLDGKLVGNPGDSPDIILDGKDECWPGLEAGGKGNLGIGGPPGIPGPPVRGVTPPLSN